MNEYDNSPLNPINNEILYVGDIGDNMSRPVSHFFAGKGIEERNSFKIERPTIVRE